MGSAFKGMRKVNVLSLPETIKEKSMFQAIKPLEVSGKLVVMVVLVS